MAHPADVLDKVILPRCADALVAGAALLETYVVAYDGNPDSAPAAKHKRAELRHSLVVALTTARAALTHLDCNDDNENKKGIERDQQVQQKKEKEEEEEKKVFWDYRRLCNEGSNMTESSDITLDHAPPPPACVAAAAQRDFVTLKIKNLVSGADRGSIGCNQETV